MRACVLIPSYNEERHIGDIVRKIVGLGFEVFVIDDGSADNTGKIASENGASVTRHSTNLGKGASLKEGFDLILKTTDFDAVITMDGDGQHSPADIQKLIACAEKEDDDIIIGNRMAHTKNMPFVRLATNRFMSFLLSAICKQEIPDTQCGFRLIKRRVLEKIKLDSAKYDLESELLIKATTNNFQIGFVSIETIYTGQYSGIHPVKDTLRFFALLFKLYLKKPMS
ncbi:MAG: glycosyltransferase family 2 protein [Candidatus Omnitrophica bacterium]|nr:glycosyltransferase family 2 protein [Candidatus Omnitrophota bacterium]